MLFFVDDKTVSCVDFECLNDGVCVQMDEEPTCICKKGFGGESCEKEGTLKIFSCYLFMFLIIFSVEETECKSNPCKNNGLCYVEGGVAKCQCTLGWGGDHCTMRMFDEPSHCMIIYLINSLFYSSMWRLPGSWKKNFSWLFI